MSSNEAIIEGGCFCGAVRYRITGKPIVVTHCHCIHCRRVHGAPMVTWAEFRSTEVTFNEVTRGRHPSREGVVRTFCTRCGTPLTYEREDDRESIDLTVGSMDDPEQVTPQDHLWTKRQLSWVRLCDDLPRYAERRTRN